MTDLEVMKATFGTLAVETGYFQVMGGFLFFLALLSALKHGGYF